MNRTLRVLGAMVLIGVGHALANPSGALIGRAWREELTNATEMQRRAEQDSAPASVVRILASRRSSRNTASGDARSLAARMNANTVSIISGTSGGTYFRMASDLAFALDDGENLRVLPILGKGAGQNAYDIRFLKGVDLGFVRSDTLEQLRADNRLSQIDRRIAYIARLFNDELHVIAGRDITDISQLAGKKVSFDVAGSGSDYTGRKMFSGLGIAVEAVNLDQPSALAELKQGQLAAVVSVAAKPVAIVAGFNPGEEGFHLLNVPRPDNLADQYFPATITHADYPRLLPDGASVKTLAVGTILGVYNWPRGTERYTRIAHFVDVFFSNFDKLLEPQRHPKWKEVNLFAEVPGWQRFPAAEEWISRHSTPVPPSAAATAAAPGDHDAKEDELYLEFLRWRRRYGL